MYTAKTKSLEETPRGLNVTVDFYKNGVFSHTESVIPQDRSGFKHWLESRKLSLTTGEQLKSELVIGEEIDLPEPEVVLTPEEIKQREFEVAKYQLIALKQEVELGLATQAEFDAKVLEVKETKETKDTETIDIK